ncbi:MAG TPA: AAA family ATPase [Chloroflexota bacterium]|jgi:DNA-binding CsgD family transcriptional regulator/tetratricopeptide (TPR) repeat protein
MPGRGADATPFVGREPELHRLQAAFEAAAAGRGTLAMVAGEPGIGKTALCGQFAMAATARGGRVLVGHCYEAGSLSLPYLPFVEVLRTYLLARAPDALAQELGADAAEIARLVPAVRGRVAVATGTRGATPTAEEARYRLLQAVISLLRNAAAEQPLVLVLEDLHDADKDTLDLLVHLARHLEGARLLVVGTYRDVEVDRAHPLVGALAELRRATSVDRLHLRGLAPAEVQRLVEEIAGRAIPPGLAGVVHRQTEGNALFVQEVTRYLVEGGLADRDDRAWSAWAEGEPAMGVPEGLRDVIGKRLARLNPLSSGVLAVAAVIGREFRLDVLQQVADVVDDDLVAALEEGVRAAVVEERSAIGPVMTYGFTHALFRQTLYEDLIAPRRGRLHRQVGRALEAVYAARRPEHAGELAEHFARSADPSDLASAVAYGELAAQRAMAVCAYGEAVRLLEQALRVQNAADAADRARRCDLLLGLADALDAAGEPRRAVDVVAPEALVLAEALGDSDRASRACHAALRGLGSFAAVPAMAQSEAAQWAARADRYAPPETVTRVWADVFLGVVRCMAGEWHEGSALLSRGLDLARRLGDADAFWWAALNWMFFLETPRHAEGRLRLAEELMAQPRAGVRARTLVGALLWIGDALLGWGLRSRAEAAWSEVRDLASRIGQPNALLGAMMTEGLEATLDGRLEEAVTVGERIAGRGDDVGLPQYARVQAEVASARALLYLGLGDVALQHTGVVSQARTLCLAHAGHTETVTALLDQLVASRAGVPAQDDETPASLDTLLLETAVLLEHRAAAGLLLRRLAASGTMTTGILYPTCVGRHLGAAAALLGQPHEARAYSETALAVARAMPFRPEIALTRLQLAELLLAHEPRAPAEARAQLEAAIAEFHEMGMRPALTRALLLEKRAGGPVAPWPGRSTPRPDGLTAREVEVLRRLALGRSNREIGAELVVSVRTVEHHIARIYGKIGARRRADATTYALRHGLVPLHAPGPNHERAPV